MFALEKLPEDFPKCPIDITRIDEIKDDPVEGSESVKLEKWKLNIGRFQKKLFHNLYDIKFKKSRSFVYRKRGAKVMMIRRAKCIADQKEFNNREIARKSNFSTMTGQERFDYIFSGKICIDGVKKSHKWFSKISTTKKIIGCLVTAIACLIYLYLKINK